MLDCRILYQIPKGFWEPWAAPKPPAVSNEPPSENFCLRACWGRSWGRKGDVDTVPETFYVPTLTVSERWANGDWTVNARWANAEWTMSERWMQVGERYVNAERWANASAYQSSFLKKTRLIFRILKVYIIDISMVQPQKLAKNIVR